MISCTSNIKWNLKLWSLVLTYHFPIVKIFISYLRRIRSSNELSPSVLHSITHSISHSSFREWSYFFIFSEIERVQIQIKVDHLRPRSTCIWMYLTKVTSCRSYFLIESYRRNGGTTKRFIHERSLSTDFFSVLSILVSIHPWNNLRN